MSNFATVSLEGDEVKIIHSSKKWDTSQKKWNIIHIDKKEVIADNEFDAYLERDKTDEYVVVCDFKEYFHDVILIPALKQKFIKKVIESEIRKATGKSDFTFIYSILGNKVVNHKKMTEVFYYMVTNDAIRNVIERFYDHGKIVKALYPAVFTAASLVDRKGSDQIKMGIIITGYKRIVFTTKNGIVIYVRDYNSLETAVSDFDIKNINMTITYFSQNLRIKPSSVTFLGDLSGLSALETKPSAPVVPPDMPGNIECACEASCGYELPCGALNVTRKVSILSQNFKKIYILRRLLEGASLTFALLSVIYISLIFYVANDVFQTRQDIQSVASGISEAQKDYGEYLDKQDSIKDMMVLVDFLNRPSINIETFLIELSDIKLQGLKFDEINAEAKGDAFFLISIKGKGLENTYSSFQSSFEKMVESLEKINNIELEKKVINHMDKTFLVQLNYRK